LNGLRQNGGLIRDGRGRFRERGRFPERGGTATPARAEDTFVGGADVGFDASVIDFFQGIAGAADEREKAKLHFSGGDGRKVDVPETEIGIEEGDAVGVFAGLRAEAADHADFRFFVLFGPAKDELLLRGKLMAGKNAGAVKAEENGGGVLGKDAAVQIAADEEDGNLLRDASAAAHNLWWQARGQRGGSGGTI